MSARIRAFPWFKPHRVMADIHDPVMAAYFRYMWAAGPVFHGVRFHIMRFHIMYVGAMLHVVDSETQAVLAACTSMQAAKAAWRLIEGF